MNTIINIVQLDKSTDADEVYTVHWTASKTVGQNTASAYGSDSFTPDPTSPDFVDYIDLDEETVVSWLNVEDIETRLDNQLFAKENPRFVSGLPWDKKADNADNAANGADNAVTP